MSNNNGSNEDQNDEQELEQHAADHAVEENNYYTANYEGDDYYEAETDKILETPEPRIFTDGNDTNYTEQDDIYSLSLPNYEAEPIYEPAPEPIAEPPQEPTPAPLTTPEQHYQPESYSNDYVEQHMVAQKFIPEEFAPSEPPVLEEAYLEPATAVAYAQEDYYSIDQAEPQPDDALNIEAQNQEVYQEELPEQYDEIEYQSDENTQYAEQPLYVEQDYVEQPHAEHVYTDEQPLTEQDENYYQPNIPVPEPEPYIEQTFDSRLPPPLAAPSPNRTNNATLHPIPRPQQQDFEQKYDIEEPPKKHILSKAWAILAILFLFVMGGVYYVYDGYASQDSTGEIPKELADTSPIKTVPAPPQELAPIATTPATTIEDILNADENANSPTLANTREDVIEQPLKSEDSVDTPASVIADNDDRDIQNVLTLLNSGVNNVEILLKPDDISNIDQNQVSVDGLDTVIVAARAVKLQDLINATSNLSEPVEVVDIDDLPVLNETTQAANENSTATELPRTTPQPLPASTRENVENVAVAATALPVAVPTSTAPTPVPNSITPRVTGQTGGDYGVQLASLPNEVAARQAYVKISGGFSGILANYRPIIKEADIPGKGIFYRVFAGPLNSYNEANQLCGELRAAGIAGCFARKM